MVKPIERHIKRQALTIIFKQLIGVFILSVVVFLFAGQRLSLSFFAGGISYSFPDLLFASRFLRYGGINEITRSLISFFTGKIVGLLLRGILVLTAIFYLPVDPLWVFIGFACCSFLFWIASMMQFAKRKVIHYGSI